MLLECLLGKAQVAAVVCNQWGDTGKGKIVDLFAAQWADVIARGTGGNNAGHTVIVNGKQRIFHLLPSGITYDEQGKVNLMGNGMVIDLGVLCRELDALEKDGGTYRNLMISRDAQVTMPYHILRDKEDQSQAVGGIGTTGRGIGPCYADKIARRGVAIRDLYNKDILAEKIRKAAQFYPEQKIEKDRIEEIVEQLQPLAGRIKPYVRDTIGEMHRFIQQGKHVLLEGAQGLLLSIEYGTYPHVTSSDCSINGTAAGVGLSARMVDATFGLVKFPFMTRVGGGPFPTEIGGSASEADCSKKEVTKEYELITYGIPYTKGDDGLIVYDCNHKDIGGMINSEDPLIQSVGIRLAAGEYGATTGRPRRVGWTDAVALRYAVQINGPLHLVLTKADSLHAAGEFRVCFGYRQNNKNDCVVTEFDRDERFLRGIHPEYAKYEGYGGLGDIRGFEGLPNTLRTAIADLERFTGSDAAIVSVGPEQSHTIIR